MNILQIEDLSFQTTYNMTISMPPVNMEIHSMFMYQFFHVNFGSHKTSAF